MEYGDNKILLQKGKYVILAVVVSGAEPADFREDIKGVINDIEGEYESLLAEWNGVTAEMAGAKKFLNRLGMHQTWEAPVIRPQAVITIASELEFFQGFVRVKVAVKNSMATVVRHSALRVLFNETVLRLDHIEPEYPVEGREIVLGDIEPHEKRTVALFHLATLYLCLVALALAFSHVLMSEPPWSMATRLVLISVPVRPSVISAGQRKSAITPLPPSSASAGIQTRMRSRSPACGWSRLSPMP
jgi:hypothetical protein